MIIDCHTHITCPTSGLAAADHLAVLDKVDVCFVLPAAQHPSSEVNRAVSEYVKQYKARMVGFGLLNPLTDRISAKVLNHLRRELLLQGVVLYCPEFDFHPAHSRAMRLYEAAQELGMPVFFHNGAPLAPKAVMDFAQPYLLDEIARTFPDLKIIIGSLGMPFIEQTTTLLNKHENVYADITMSPKRPWQLYNAIMAASERDVLKKLIFGSGFPLGSPEPYLEALLGFNRLFANTNLPMVSRESIREVVERNSLELLGLKVETPSQVPV
jgi:predicted TIM-barrel fold metal-dependent hydrolase